MAFGKRTKPPASSRDDGLSRVFPKKVFEGETGEFLKSLGFHPDDPGNILDNIGLPEGELAAHHLEFQNQLTQINQSLPFQVAPVHLFPESLWRQSEAAWFLIHRLSLYPFRPWNTIFLPLDAAGAGHTGLPIRSSVSHNPELNAISPLVSEIKKTFAGVGDNISEVITTLADGLSRKKPFLFPQVITVIHLNKFWLAEEFAPWRF